MQEGDFEMIIVDRKGSRAFNVAVAPFSFSLLGDSGGETTWDRIESSPSQIAQNKHSEYVIGRCSHSHIMKLNWLFA